MNLNAFFLFSAEIIAKYVGISVMFSGKCDEVLHLLMRYLSLDVAAYARFVLFYSSFYLLLSSHGLVVKTILSQSGDPGSINAEFCRSGWHI